MLAVLGVSAKIEARRLVDPHGKVSRGRESSRSEVRPQVEADAASGAEGSRGSERVAKGEKILQAVAQSYNVHHSTISRLNA